MCQVNNKKKEQRHCRRSGAVVLVFHTFSSVSILDFQQLMEYLKTSAAILIRNLYLNRVLEKRVCLQINARSFYPLPICSQCTFSLPHENIRNPHGFLMFSGGALETFS